MYGMKKRKKIKEKLLRVDFVMNLLKNHHDELNMQMKNSKFISFMYNLCENAYNDSRDVDYSISYHAVNTDEFSHLQPSLFMDKLFIDEIHKKLNFCYKSSVTIKNKTFYITFYNNLNQKINFTSYMNKIIFDDSNKLNDFTNIGFQRHLCSVDEINLMEKLFFEYISLGEITENNLKAEPVIRNANIVGFDMKSLSNQGNPNGIDPRLSCILSKYAGQSNRADFLGLFELNNNLIANKLYSEIIWYFIDGIDKRVLETDFYDSQTFNKYIVQTSGRDITFFKSKISEKWWVLIDSSKNNATNFLPCLEEDYKDALNDNIPIRWLKATKRN